MLLEMDSMQYSSFDISLTILLNISDPILGFLESSQATAFNISSNENLVEFFKPFILKRAD